MTHRAEHSIGSEISVAGLSVPIVRWTAEGDKAILICSSQMLSVHGKLEAEGELVIELHADCDVNTKNPDKGCELGLQTYNVTVVSSNDLFCLELAQLDHAISQ